MTPSADITRFVTAFEHREAARNGSHFWLGDLRREAMRQFTTLGFPTRKTEAWKYTNIASTLRRTLATDVSVVSVDNARAAPIPGLDAHVIVFDNGRYRAALSHIQDLPDGVLVTGLAEAAQSHAWLLRRYFGRVADYETCPFVALNTAFTEDSAVVYVPANTVLERPVHLVHRISSGQDALVQPRVLVIAEDNARLTLIQTSVTTSAIPTFTNAVTEIFVGRDAHLERIDIQDEPDGASVVSSLDVTQDTGSTFHNSSFTLGGSIVRNNINVLTDAEHCQTFLNGLFLAEGASHVDNHTLIDHAKPQCYSSEYYKGILDDRATGVFNGKVLVRQDAQQINAYQSNKSIVLADTARMYAKPELEIYADDVKCSHGATTGQLDDEAIFYLRARGLTEKQARSLMLVSFARDVTERVTIAPLREVLDALITEHLGA